MVTIQHNKKVPTSVQKTIIRIFVVTYVLTLITLLLSSQAQSIIVNEYNDYIEVNRVISEISVAFPESLNHFEQYTRTKEMEHLEAYTKSVLYIKTQLENLDRMIKFDAETKVFYRNIGGMFDSYKTFVTEGFNTSNETTPETYDLYNDIDLQMDYIITHMHLLTRSYLEYHDQTYKEALKVYDVQRRRSYLFISVTLIFAAVMTYYTIKKILNAINNLCIQASMLSKNQWEIEDIEEDKYEELYTLGIAFNNMKHELKKYVDEELEKAEISVKLKEEQLRIVEKEQIINETQLKALQMQMNPHFLFNTLNIISRLALFKDVPDITKVTEELSEILRYNLYYKDDMVSLEKELEVLSAYVNIQSIRFEDNIIFEFDICDDTRSIFIPPMILQPIVENAIVHGCRDKKEGGKVVVLVYNDENYVNIEISDNGEGFDTEHKLSSEAINTGESIGLSNVTKRLSIVFKREDLLTITSVKNTGTRVAIRIPLEEKHV